MSDNKTPRVFLYQKPRRKISTDQLECFGEIVYLFDEGDPRPSIFATDKLNAEIMKRLYAADYDPSVDFFCASGSLITVAICCAILGRTATDFRVVAFSSSEDRYVSMTLGGLAKSI